MIRTYARRLLSPFVGLVQVAETNNARALSLDGRNWAIQYALAEAAETRDWRPRADPDLHFSLREDWENLRQQELCDLYVRRLAPRLLMLQGLPQAVRRRLEQAAHKQVFDVERFYPLYSEVVDKRLLTAARVEAQLRAET